MSPACCPYFLNLFERCCGDKLFGSVSKDYEDAHGELSSKLVLQHVLCPHELVATFHDTGELARMTGEDDSCLILVDIA